MSLINQMLKELDARRSEPGGASPFGGHVRAVPQRRGPHPAWWVALGAFLGLGAVVAWFILRPVAQPYLVQAQLPLKMDVGLNPVAPARPDEPVASAPATLPVASEERPAAVLPPSAEAEPAPTLAAMTAADAAAQARVPSAPAAPAAFPPSPAAPPSPLRPAAALPAAHRAEPVAAPVDSRVPAQPITKQVQEPTRAQRAENEFRKATVALQHGRRADAENGFEQALILDAGHAAARQALIALLLEGKNVDEAVRLAREGLEQDARQTGFAMILARLQVEKGELKPAIDTLQRSRQHATERADYIAFLAALLQRAERHAEAIEQYAQALQRTPQNGVWWMGLGISLQAEQRRGEAMEAFARAKASQSLSPDLVAFVETRLAQLK